ncbi:MAG: hypothetical protein ACOCRX_06230 [Candidatus Woesearchaeota archaeon]
MKNEKISDLKFILENKNINLDFERDLLNLLDIVENDLEDQNKDFILKITEKILDFLLKNSLKVASKDIMKKSCLIIKELDLKQKKITRNIDASLLILNQDMAIRDAANALKEITQKVENYKKVEPETYKLSRNYFKDL